VKILVDVPVDPAALAALLQTGLHEIDCIEPPAEAARPIDAARIRGTEALFCSVPPVNFADMRSLRWVQLASSGYSQLFGLDLPQRGIRATNCRGCFDVPIAEWNVAMMVNLARDVRQMIRNQEAAVWDRSARFQREIRGLTVGLWGYGGIGRETALTLARTGLFIVIASPEVENNEKVKEEILADGGEAMTLNLDISSPEAVKESFAKVNAEKGHVDILVNNAGITRDGLAVRMKQADWELVLKINLFGAFYCVQAALPGMMKARWGRIVNMASVVGLAGSPGQANYAASKAGLIGMTKSLAQEVGSRGITVNAVAPGYVATDMTAALPEELRQKMLASIPLGRLGVTTDIANAVKFLVSEDAGYITGHVLSVNGGMYM